jgi:hypothetical protein
MKIKNLALLPILFCVLFISCKKDEKDALTPIFYPFYDFFKDNGTQPQIFTVNASEGFSITTTAGTIFTFQPNSFINENNENVNGEITVFIKEIDDYKDMILSNTVSTTNSKLIFMAVEFHVIANQNNKTLNLKIPYKVSVKPRPGLVDLAKLYYGQIVNMPVNSNNENLNWQIDTAEYRLESINNHNYLTCNANKLGWIACGNPWNLTQINKNTLTINLPSNYYQSNSIVFIAPLYYNTVGRALPENQSSNTYSFDDVPSSGNYFITISYQNSKYYFDLTQINVFEDDILNITPNESTKEDIIIEINNLY